MTFTIPPGAFKFISAAATEIIIVVVFSRKLRVTVYKRTEKHQFQINSSNPHIKNQEEMS